MLFSLIFPIHWIEIFCTSATTGEGVDELARHVLARRALHDGDHAVSAAQHFFRRWVVDEWGRVGSRHLERLGGAAALVGSEDALATAQDDFERSIRAALAAPH